MCMYNLQSSFVFLPILTISVSELSTSSVSVCSSSVFMSAPPNSSVSLNGEGSISFLNLQVDLIAHDPL